MKRNPNVDPERTEPLTDVEIKTIKEASNQFPELGSWNLSLLLSNEFAVHVSTMSILRVLYPERYKSQKNDEKVNFYISMRNTSFRIERVLKRRFLNISDSETSRKGSGRGMGKPPHRY